MEGIEVIGDASAPSARERSVGHAALPLGDLVRVGEQLRRLRRGAVVRPGDAGTGEGPDIRDEGEFAVVEHVAHVPELGMKTESPEVVADRARGGDVGGHGREWMHLRCRDGECPASRRIRRAGPLVVAARRPRQRDEHVVGVISPAQKDADESLVIAAAPLGVERSLHEFEVGEGVDHAGHAHRPAPDLREEATPRERVDRFFGGNEIHREREKEGPHLSTSAWGEVATR